MSSLFWNTFRNMYPSDSYTAEVASQAHSEASQTSENLRDTDERLDQLLLVCAAMWEILSEKMGVTEAELVARIAEMDARDGTADGKMTQTPRKCPKCNRPVFPRHQKCLYCGAQTPTDSVFKAI